MYFRLSLFNNTIDIQIFQIKPDICLLRDFLFCRQKVNLFPLFNTNLLESLALRRFKLEKLSDTITGNYIEKLALFWYYIFNTT